jgi:hypothetical protein
MAGHDTSHGRERSAHIGAAGNTLAQHTGQHPTHIRTTSNTLAQHTGKHPTHIRTTSNTLAQPGTRRGRHQPTDIGTARLSVAWCGWRAAGLRTARFALARRDPDVRGGRRLAWDDAFVRGARRSAAAPRGRAGCRVAGERTDRTLAGGGSPAGRPDRAGKYTRLGQSSRPVAHGRRRWLASRNPASRTAGRRTRRLARWNSTLLRRRTRRLARWNSTLLRRRTKRMAGGRTARIRGRRMARRSSTCLGSRGRRMAGADRPARRPAVGPAGRNAGPRPGARFRVPR